MCDVLFMCQFFYPEEVSSSLLPYQTAEKFISEGLKVSVLCGYPKEHNCIKGKSINKKEIKNGIEINRIKYIQFNKKRKIARLINYFSFIVSMFFKLEKCREAKIIFVYSNPPLLPIISLIANKLYKTKIVFVSYDVYPEIAVKLDVLKENSIVSRVTRSVNEQLFKKASKIVVLSEDMKEFYIHHKKIPSKNIKVIENWATESFEEIKTVTDPQFKEIKSQYDLIVTYLGNMGKAQDIQTILTAASSEQIRSKNIAFVFAGRGEKFDFVLNQKKDNNLENVYIFDYLLSERLNELLNISDMFFVSLEKNLEGLAVPSKTYSYYQAQKPIIAIMNKNTQIYKEIDYNECGFCLNNGDSKKLIDKLSDIITDSLILDNYKLNMQKFSKKYNEGRQLNEYLNVVQKVLEE